MQSLIPLPLGRGLRGGFCCVSGWTRLRLDPVMPVATQALPLMQMALSLHFARVCMGLLAGIPQSICWCLCKAPVLAPHEGGNLSQPGAQMLFSPVGCLGKNPCPKG